jgi:LacI family transcriptional regulator
MQAVRGVGLATPGDLSLVSFGDTDWARVLDPPLTVVEQPGHALGVAAARRPIARVRGDLAPVEALPLDATWIDRGSTARPRAEPDVWR